MSIKKYLILSSMFFLIACSNQDDRYISNIEKFVAGFHQDFIAGDFSSIYQGSAQGLRSGVDETEFVKALSSIRAIMGKPDNSKLTKIIKTSDDKGRPLIAAEYETNYPDGIAMELFHFEVSAEDVTLFRYDFNSDDYINKLVEMSASEK